MHLQAAAAAAAGVRQLGLVEEVGVGVEEHHLQERAAGEEVVGEHHLRVEVEVAEAHRQ